MLLFYNIESIEQNECRWTGYTIYIHVCQITWGVQFKMRIFKTPEIGSMKSERIYWNQGKRIWKMERVYLNKIFTLCKRASLLLAHRIYGTSRINLIGSYALIYWLELFLSYSLYVSPILAGFCSILVVFLYFLNSSSLFGHFLFSCWSLKPTDFHLNWTWHRISRAFNVHFSESITHHFERVKSRLKPILHGFSLSHFIHKIPSFWPLYYYAIVNMWR